MALIPSLAACPPGILPAATVQAIIENESGGDVLAIRVNNASVAFPRPIDAAQAATVAMQLIKSGYSVDLGLMQVNSANLAVMHVSVADMFDPCTNIAVGSQIFAADYAAALRAMKVGADAVTAALSAYNTGNFVDGVTNGYVARYDISGGMAALQAQPPSLFANRAPDGTIKLTVSGPIWLAGAWRGGPAVPLKPADFIYSDKPGPVLRLTRLLILQAHLAKAKPVRSARRLWLRLKLPRGSRPAAIGQDR